MILLIIFHPHLHSQPYIQTIGFNSLMNLDLLIVPGVGPVDLRDCIRYFSSPHRFPSEICTKCGVQGSINSISEIWTFPKILIIRLARFHRDMVQGDRFIKIETPVAIPPTLDLSHFQKEPRGSSIYTLFALSVCRIYFPFSHACSEPPRNIGPWSLCRAYSQRNFMVPRER